VLLFLWSHDTLIDEPRGDQPIVSQVREFGSPEESAEDILELISRHKASRCFVFLQTIAFRLSDGDQHLLPHLKVIVSLEEALLLMSLTAPIVWVHVNIRRERGEEGRVEEQIVFISLRGVPHLLNECPHMLWQLLRMGDLQEPTGTVPVSQQSKPEERP
jgi:hypothetical protein